MSKNPLEKRIIVYVLFFVSLCMFFFTYSKNEDYNNLKNVLNEEKQDLQLELSGIVEDYEKLNVKNKQLSTRIINEINKIIALKESIKNLEIENFDLIRSFRKKTSLFQLENQRLATRIDSLNTINKKLKEKNILASKVLEEKVVLTQVLKKKNDNLEKANETLKIQMEPARKIKVSPIKAIALKERNSGKLTTTSKHNRTDAIRVNFKLLENTLTVPGDKKIIIQLQDKENNVIAAKSEKTTLKNDKKIDYSDRLIADYNNEEVDVLSLILVDRKNMEKGDYKINVFIDGDFSSSSVVTLR